MLVLIVILFALWGMISTAQRLQWIGESNLCMCKTLRVVEKRQLQDWFRTYEYSDIYEVFGEVVRGARQGRVTYLEG